MRKGTSFLIYPLLIVSVLIVCASSCKKDYGNNIPVLTTAAVTDITHTTAVCGGDISSDAGTSVTACGVCWSTGQTPTIADNKTTEGAGVGNFVSYISGLQANTTYYIRAYATNNNGTGYGSVISFTTLDTCFVDPRDSNVYKTVIIGNQVWMAENLKYLPSVVGPGTGSKTEPRYYVYGYDSTEVNDAKATANYATYGVLYNWPAVMDGESSSITIPSGVQGVCPTGWHLPSDAEWTQLTNYLGGDNLAGGKLKETGTKHWAFPNTGATNETGFTALPGGSRNNDGTFDRVGLNGFWWSATEDVDDAWYLALRTYGSNTIRNGSPRDLGSSVRCLKN